MNKTLVSSPHIRRPIHVQKTLQIDWKQNAQSGFPHKFQIGCINNPRKSISGDTVNAKSTCPVSLFDFRWVSSLEVAVNDPNYRKTGSLRGRKDVSIG
jgi:hypothetical protein